MRVLYIQCNFQKIVPAACRCLPFLTSQMLCKGERSCARSCGVAVGKQATEIAVEMRPASFVMLCNASVSTLICAEASSVPRSAVRCRPPGGAPSRGPPHRPRSRSPHASSPRPCTHMREREVLPTTNQQGLARVGHESPLNANCCADHPANKSNASCTISFTPACACRTCIDHILTSSHIHYSDEPNAIVFTQVLALSHRAQV